MSRGALIAAAVVAVAVAAVHILAAGQYDLFRNELYFIVCGWHPSFGYVDQPPLVPLIAALFWIGNQVWLERVPAIIAAVALVPLVVDFARILGASTRGAWLAAVAVASSTLLTALSATVGTSTFEPITFTAFAYLITRFVLNNEPRALWWAGLIAGISFEMRYGIVMWAVALFVGVLVIGPRSLLRSRDLWIGVGIASVIALPNVIWQAVHVFPFLELVRNDSSGNLIGSPIEFAIQQVFLVNEVLTPLWFAGIIAPFFAHRLKQFRFLSLTFVAFTVFVVASHGKAYYMAAAYPTIFALGASAWRKVWRWFVAVFALLAATNAFLGLPFVLPVEPPAKLLATIQSLPFKMKPLERAGIGAPLQQMLSDEFGWRDLAADVGNVYGALPPTDRAKAAIFAENYGDASAIDVFGKDLPGVISGNNQYYLWGAKRFDGSVVIAVNVNPATWATLCDSSTVVAHSGTSPYAMPYENNRPIVLCRGLHKPLSQVLTRFKYYGIENLGQKD